MITIRHAMPEDVALLHAADGFEYQLPEFDRPDWVVRAVLEDDGKPNMALLLRRTAEAYLLVGDQAGHGADRIGKILALEREVNAIAAGRGYQDIHAWLAPPIARNFGRHLLKRGWTKPLWEDYVRPING